MSTFLVMLNAVIKKLGLFGIERRCVYAKPGTGTRTGPQMTFMSKVLWFFSDRY